MALLLSAGAAVDAHEWDNPAAYQLRWHARRGTALHLACHENHVEAARLLINAGANPFSAKRSYHKWDPATPYDIALQGGNEDLICLLESVISVQTSRVEIVGNHEARYENRDSEAFKPATIERCKTFFV